MATTRPVLDFSMERDNDLVTVLRQFRQTQVYLRDAGEEAEKEGASAEGPVLRANKEDAQSPTLATGVSAILQHLLAAEWARAGEKGQKWVNYVIDRVRPVARKPEPKWTSIPTVIFLFRILNQKRKFQNHLKLKVSNSLEVKI